MQTASNFREFIQKVSKYQRRIQNVPKDRQTLLRQVMQTKLSYL